MQLTSGINHVATLTTDVERLKAFYQDVFGATTAFDLEDGGMRHAMIMVGPLSGIHAFQVKAGAIPDTPQPMFSRGRLDHVAVTAADRDSFDELRTRAIGRGADGDVVDYGAALAFNMHDPDGGEIEVCYMKVGVEFTTPPPDPAAAAARIRA
jgi:catechol 2,3-dioxygenase-like lactoylglutathione lyase family enzyme